jgi:hypothetical protein
MRCSWSSFEVLVFVAEIEIDEFHIHYDFERVPFSDWLIFHLNNHGEFLFDDGRLARLKQEKLIDDLTHGPFDEVYDWDAISYVL